jgi:hypothetical protein
MRDFRICLAIVYTRLGRTSFDSIHRKFAFPGLRISFLSFKMINRTAPRTAVDGQIQNEGCSYSVALH